MLTKKLEFLRNRQRLNIKLSGHLLIDWITYQAQTDHLSHLTMYIFYFI